MPPLPSTSAVSVAPATPMVVEDEHLDNLAQLIAWLWQMGFLAYPSITKAVESMTAQQLALTLKAYQGFHGLPVTGRYGPATKRSINAQRYCPRPDMLAMTSQDKWPTADLRYWLDPNTLSGLTMDPISVIAAFDWAWQQWAQVCAIRPQRVADMSKANVLVQFGPIDGQGKILAESELPDGTAVTKHQRFDCSEAYAFGDTVPPCHVDLGRIAAHEIGHVLGLPHLESGNLMQAMYDPKIRSPQLGDIREAVSRYGVAVPVMHSTLPPAGSTDFVISVRGSGVLGDIKASGFTITRA